MSRRFVRPAAALLAVSVVMALGSGPAYSRYQPGLPPNIDPGTPVFSGSPTPVPAEPAPFDPATSMLTSVYGADVASGGDSYWFDRILERPFLGNQDSHLYTRGRALYMYAHNAGPLGFAGGFAYRERSSDANVSIRTRATRPPPAR